MNDDHHHLRRADNETRYAQQRDKLSHHRLRVWAKARELLRLVSKNAIGDAELRHQASRAAKSVGCNIAEGAALEGGSKKKHYKIAKGSVVEVVAAYELADDIGEVLPVDDVTRLAAAIASMLTGLIRK